MVKGILYTPMIPRLLGRGAAAAALPSLTQRALPLRAYSATSEAQAASATGGGDPRLASFRKVMAEHGLDAFLVPSDDPHLSEYVAPHFRRREFVSGFTGSAGTAVVTRDAALLWTDGRYFLQVRGREDARA